MNFDPFFQQYEALVAVVDRAFEKIKKDYPEEVRCASGCADCCHALFDLSLIEAFYLNRQFNANLTGKKKDKILEEANRADRQTYKIKKDAFNQFQEGVAQTEIFETISGAKVRCPLLGAENTCELYTYRPITCRVYGIPLSIDGAGRTCGLSGFKPKETYPTINMDAIHRRLHDISKAFVVEIKSKYPKLDDLLVPVSMSLLNAYDEEYLGTGGVQQNPEVNTQQDKANE